LATTLEAKRLGLLHNLVPQAATIGVLLNPASSTAASQLRDLQEAARAIGLQLYVLRASTDGEIDAAFESVAQNHIPALSMAGDPFFNSRRAKLVALAARHAVPQCTALRLCRGRRPNELWDRLPDVYPRLAFMSAKFSKAPSLPICRWSSRPPNRST
jgi:hypothetical protein